MAEKQILAIVTKNREKVGGTGPIFFADSDEELVHTATLLARYWRRLSTTWIMEAWLSSGTRRRMA